MSNALHTIFINTNGELFTFGKNTYGQLGLGDTIDRIEPTQITIDNSNNLIQGSVGESHSAVLYDNGDIYTWGLNTAGRTGLNTISGNTLTPTKIITFSPSLSSDEKIVQISCGNIHTGFLTNQGNLYLCGSNENSRLGRNTTTGNTIIPTQVDVSSILDVTDSIDKVVCGSDFTMILTVDGKVYVTGNNENGRTGRNTTSGNTLIFTQITNFSPYLGNSENIADIGCGSAHSAFLTTEGNLYTCGLNDNGRTGLNLNSGDTILPTKVTTFSPEIPNGVTMDAISCGDTHTTILLSNNDVYTFGINNFKNVTEENYYTKNEITDILQNYYNQTEINLTLNDYALNSAFDNYLTISDISNNYVSNSQLNTSLSNYVTSSNLTTTLNNYVTDTSLTTTLNNYVTDTSLTTTLNNYVTDTSLTSTLNDYVTDTSLTTTLNNYVTDTSLTTTLNDYVTDTSLTTTLNDYVTDTSLTTTLNNYITDTSLTSTLNDYVTDTSLSTILDEFVTVDDFNNTLNNYTDTNNLQNNYVNLATSQTISGKKTFTDVDVGGLLQLNGSGNIYPSGWHSVLEMGPGAKLIEGDDSTATNRPAIGLYSASNNRGIYFYSGNQAGNQQGGGDEAPNYWPNYTISFLDKIYSQVGINVSDTTSSSSQTTGALTVSGGVGVGENLNVNGYVKIYDVTASTSYNTGSFITSGGVGIGGNINANGNISLNGGILNNNERTIGMKDDSSTTDYVNMVFSYKADADYTGIIKFNTKGNIYNSPLSEAMRISGNNLGVGTTNPEEKVHVDGNIRIDNGRLVLQNNSGNGATRSVQDGVYVSNEITGISSHGRDAGQLRLSAGGAGGDGPAKTFIDMYAYDTDEIRFGTQETQRMVIGQTGNLGIGTTSPQDRLHVKDGNIIVEDSFENSPSLTLIRNFESSIYGGDSRDDFKLVNEVGIFKIKANSTTSGENTNLSIYPTGNVGIGGDYDSNYTLNVNGSAKITNSLSVKTPHIIYGGSPYLYLRANPTDPNDGTNEYRIWADTSTSFAGDLNIDCNAGTAFTLNHSGNVGIGTTAPSAKLDVNGNTVINSTTSSTNPTTGALVVDGGVGIAENLNVGGNLSISGSLLGNSGNPVDVYNTYTIDFTGGDINSFYPVLINGAKTFEFYLHKTLQIDSAIINNHIMYGTTAGGGWSDYPKGNYEITLNYYDINEKSILGIYRGTQSFNGICIYLRGGSGGIYYLTVNSNDVTSSLNLVSNGDSTFAIKNDSYQDIVGSSSNTTAIVETLYLDRGKYISGDLTLDSGDLKISGNLGIGTIPQDGLHVKDGNIIVEDSVNNIPSLTLIRNNGSSIYGGDSADDFKLVNEVGIFKIKANSTTSGENTNLSIYPTGNVGIGGDYDSNYTLNVNGSAKITNSLSVKTPHIIYGSIPNLYFRANQNDPNDETNEYRIWANTSTSFAGDLNIDCNTGTALIINHSKGIVTGGDLYVSGQIQTPSNLYVGGITGLYQNGVRMHYSSNGSGYIDYKGLGSIFFRADNNTGSSERMSISSDGTINLGGTVNLYGSTRSITMSTLDTTWAIKNEAEVDRIRINTASNNENISIRGRVSVGGGSDGNAGEVRLLGKVYARDDDSQSMFLHVGGGWNGGGHGTAGHLNFTAGHDTYLECDISLNHLDGMIVESLGKPLINPENYEYLIFTQLSKTKNNKRVAGVFYNNDVSKYAKDETINTFSEEIIENDILEKANFRLLNEYIVKRNDINGKIISIGEGTIWVCNENGYIENGDFITSSTIPGFGMKQISTILENITVAKSYLDCDFSESFFEYIQPKKQIISESYQRKKTIKTTVQEVETSYDTSSGYVEVLNNDGTKEMKYFDKLLIKVDKIIEKEIDKVISREINVPIIDSSGNLLRIEKHSDYEMETITEKKEIDLLDSSGNIVYETIYQPKYEMRWIKIYSNKYVVYSNKELSEELFTFNHDFSLNPEMIDKIFIASRIGCTYHCG